MLKIEICARILEMQWRPTNEADWVIYIVV
jgi:hypothetical protein